MKSKLCHTIIIVLFVVGCGRARQHEQAVPARSQSQTLTQHRGWACQGTLPSGEAVSFSYENIYKMTKPAGETLDESAQLGEENLTGTTTVCQAGPESGDPKYATMDGPIVSCIYPVHTKDQVVFRYDPAAHELTAKLVGPQISAPQAYPFPCEPVSKSEIAPSR